MPAALSQRCVPLNDVVAPKQPRSLPATEARYCCAAATLRARGATRIWSSSKYDVPSASTGVSKSGTSQYWSELAKRPDAPLLVGAAVAWNLAEGVGTVARALMPEIRGLNATLSGDSSSFASKDSQGGAIPSQTSQVPLSALFSSGAAGHPPTDPPTSKNSEPTAAAGHPPTDPPTSKSSEPTAAAGIAAGAGVLPAAAVTSVPNEAGVLELGAGGGDNNNTGSGGPGDGSGGGGNNNGGGAGGMGGEGPSGPFNWGGLPPAWLTVPWLSVIVAAPAGVYVWLRVQDPEFQQWWSTSFPEAPEGVTAEEFCAWDPTYLGCTAEQSYSLEEERRQKNKARLLMLAVTTLSAVLATILVKKPPSGKKPSAPRPSHPNQAVPRVRVAGRMAS